MRIHFVDTFTDRPFSGNPAAVVLLEDGFPPDERLQRLASQLNLSETAYARPLPPGAEADWALRWFTPAAEVRLCGHATLATAHVLRISGRLAGEVRFATLSGVLTATGETEGPLTLDFPTAPLTPVQDLAGASEALGGTRIRSAWRTGPDVGDLLLEVEDERAVRSVSPAPGRLAGLSDRGVIVTARAADASSAYDYVSRCFYPDVGVGEDPVTGSAHTALAPFWSPRLGSEQLVGYQASARGGIVHTTVRGERTLLGGDAVAVMDAELRVPL
ncbi:PhzF family phenazine biosynthesis protein [Streptomyces sp. XM4193]|uniref:PhzF family phenazine biosynthesis protein n=1 Tax=Streptomyces sp. XM4193 TaxID=2929782 RepID=UPI001FF8829F|nr:PhzF family phenazine biosynthesis protein [Streptomyces sp. XM4193]MCK1799014.1 PhzF family phenazine biosynthesis protein [Streptomyces sp. XM4193]